MRKRTDYGKSVMHRLVDLDQTPKWLVEQMTIKAEEHEVNYFIDVPKLSNYLVGLRQNPMTRLLIEEVLCEAEKNSCVGTQ